MNERVILHCDLNNFFASVEMFLNPELANVPIAVCGSVEERHGIVLAKNEKAKKFGVQTAEAIWQAQLKCPDLVLVSPHYEKYLEFSAKVRAIYEEYTDLVEPFGIDECWLDVTGSVLLYGSGENIAEELRRRIKEEVGLTISVGVSFNKIFAKLGSDLKKPDAVTIIPKANFKNIIWHLPAESMIGIGKATKARLNSIGIFTLGELAACDVSALELNFGKMGAVLWKNANGYDKTPVLSKMQMPPTKSFGRSMTTRYDLTSTQQVSNLMLYLTDKVAKSLRENNVLATLVQISVRDEHLVTREHQMVLEQPTRLVDVLFSAAMQLFHECWKWETNVRSVGIRACGLVGENSNFQLSLFCDTRKNEKMERLESQIHKIRSKYGNASIFRCSTMNIAKANEKELCFMKGYRTNQSSDRAF
ncbi:MAG: DNA polymerase IV [Faecalibacterium sp.]|nr:DNA polymerase IV [Ruminococcus sp.]MCM1391405.1 DNA polymerase IV [Ruminococcus sp.]MCM1486672.1 DNA polymerase IV [Faecalibacterium sp.]